MLSASCSDDGAGLPGFITGGQGGVPGGGGGIVGAGGASGGVFGAGGEVASGGLGSGGIAASGGIGGIPGAGVGGIGGIPGAGVGGIGGIPGSDVGGFPSELSIDAWHGASIDVGGPDSLGVPQAFVNVLGRVSSPGGISSASYQINAGERRALSLGPNSTRLSGRGDFNVEVPLDELEPFPRENSVRLFASDGLGEERERAIAITYRPLTAPSKPSLFVDWTTLSSIAEVRERAAIVDGRWELRAGGLHVLEMGYDRLIAVGDARWSPGYEVVATATLHDFRTYGGLGVAIGWQGHSGSSEPRTGWPLEALGWVRFHPDGPKTQIMTFEHNEIAEQPTTMTPGATYVYRVRSERLGGGIARFSVKCWPDGDAEPNGVDLERDVPERAGSVLLVAHHADVTWKTLKVTPIP